MHARIIRATGIEHVEAGLHALQDRALPVVRSQDGYVSLSCSVDVAAGTGSIVSLWDSEDDMLGSDVALGAVRSEVAQAFGVVALTSHHYEVAVGHQSDKGIAEGCWVRSVRFEVDPARLDDALRHFHLETLPEVEATVGFRGAFAFVDRASGELFVSTAWDSRASMDAGEEAGTRRREAAADAFAMQVTEVAHRELMLVDRP